MKQDTVQEYQRRNHPGGDSIVDGRECQSTGLAGGVRKKRCELDHEDGKMEDD